VSYQYGRVERWISKDATTCTKDDRPDAEEDVRRCKINAGAGDDMNVWHEVVMVVYVGPT
jgi:hypothetical protein